MNASIDIQRTRAPRQRPPQTELGFGRYFTDHMFLMDYQADKGWHAPRVVPYGPLSVEPAAAGLHYGQTVFEGLKAFPDAQRNIRLFRMRDHMARINESAKRVCIPPIDSALATRGVETLLALDADWMPTPEGTSIYVRPLVFATEGFLGVRPSKQYKLVAFLSPVGNYYAAGLNPVKIWVEQKATRAAPGGLGMAKTGANYAASLRAAEEAKGRGYAQVLWLDAKEHRYLEEVGTMNLFLKLGDEVVTPPLEGTLLAGITRSTVLTLLRELGVKVTERRITFDEVQAAAKDGRLQEVFGTGTAAVISPVGELGHEGGTVSIGDGKVGPLALKLRQLISDIQYGRVPDKHGWLTPVPPLDAEAAA